MEVYPFFSQQLCLSFSQPDSPEIISREIILIQHSVSLLCVVNICDKVYFLPRLSFVLNRTELSPPHKASISFNQNWNKSEPGIMDK